jgi:hypothetical protein
MAAATTLRTPLGRRVKVVEQGVGTQSTAPHGRTAHVRMQRTVVAARAAPAMARRLGTRVLLTTGHKVLPAFAGVDGRGSWVRCVTAPPPSLPPRHGPPQPRAVDGRGGAGRDRPDTALTLS